MKKQTTLFTHHNINLILIRYFLGFGKGNIDVKFFVLAPMYTEILSFSFCFFFFPNFLLVNYT
jgi:hypothetical protein